MMLYQPISVGDHIACYVKQVREDGKIDLGLRKTGMEGLKGDAAILLQLLESNGGQLSIGDKSSPDEIKQIAQMSKKAFKRAAGTLYKARKVQIEDQEIRLV